MEFKGTKELGTGNLKWYSKDGKVYNTKPEFMYEFGGGIAGLRPIATINQDKKYFIGENETMYNEILIANAPEMLEELIESVTDLKILKYQIEQELKKGNSQWDGMDFKINWWIERKEELIKKSTTII